MDAHKIVITQYGKVSYTEIGPPDGEVILFSTGGGASFDLVHAFEWLAKEGFRLISINRPGYFDLPVDIVNTIEGHADIYHEVILALDINVPLHVFGISMGGLSALYYAKNYPTKSLVLWSAVTGKYEVNKKAANSALGKLILSTHGKRFISWILKASAKYFPKQTLKSFLKAEANISNKQRSEIARQVINNPQSKHEFEIFIESLTPMNALYEGMMDEVKKAEQLNEADWTRISCPVFAVHSTVDKDVSLDHAKRLENMINDITMKYVEGGGHFVWWGEEGKQVKAETLDFLNWMRRSGTTNSISDKIN